MIQAQKQVLSSMVKTEDPNMRTYNYKHFLIDRHEKTSTGEGKVSSINSARKTLKLLKSIDSTL